MGGLDWNSIIGNIISEFFILAIGGIGGLFIGWIKGKKVSVDATRRKKEIYQPLIDELEPYSKKVNMLAQVKTSFLDEIVTNSYKYGLKQELQNSCNTLTEYIKEYNSINCEKIAKETANKIFSEGFEIIYGSIYETVDVWINDEIGFIEENIVVAPVEEFIGLDYGGLVTDLLKNEGFEDYPLSIGDLPDEITVYIYSQLETMYRVPLNFKYEYYTLPEPRINLYGMLPSEYIAHTFDFFERYNQHIEIIRKEELREEIMSECKKIVALVQNNVAEIVKKYEVE